MNTPKVKTKNDLYALKVTLDELVYCIKDNTFYHLRDISRSNKSDGWEQVAAIPKNTIAVSQPSGIYLTQSVADLRYVQYQNVSVKPAQTIYGDINLVGNLTATGEVSAFSGSAPTNWWDSMPYAQSGVNAHTGGIKVGSNLTIDINGYLNASIAGGAGTWGSIGGDIRDPITPQADLVAELDARAPTIHDFIHMTNHPVTGLTAGQYLRALSSTTYGFESVSTVIADPTPIINQVAIWLNETTIKGVAGLMYDGTTLSITGNITATGEISAFAGSAPNNWWTSMPYLSTNGSGAIGGLQLDGNTTHFFRGDGAWSTVTSGTFVHSELSGLDYASSGHTGFQPTLSGTGFIKANGSTISYDNSTYLTTTLAANTYAPLASPSFTGLVTISAPNSDVDTQVLMLSHRATGNIVTGTELAIGANATYSHTKLIGYDNPNHTNNSQFAIQTYGASGWITGLFQNELGYIGIRDTNPGYALTVVGSGTTAAKFGTGTNSNVYLGATSDIPYIQGAGTNNILAFWTDIERMRLTSAGLSIGATTVRANTVLDVNGGIGVGRMGVMGTYNGAQIQGIWLISPSYVVDLLNNNGGNAYGMGYAYEDTGFGRTGYGHQICFLGNGINYASISMNTGKSYFAGAMAVNSSITGVSLKTANFSIEESGANLIIKYGATVIASISSAGYLKAKDEVGAFESI